MVWNTTVSKLVSAVLANSQLLIACKLWLACESAQQNQDREILVGLDDLWSLCQQKQFYDSMKLKFISADIRKKNLFWKSGQKL